MIDPLPNLMMPGNPRYQPQCLVPYFGYDNLARFAVEVELAVMRELGHMGHISPEHMALLTPEVERRLLAITTSLVDLVERTNTPEFGTKTRHDVRALVRIMQAKMPAELRRYVHVPLTSYDVLDTARALMFVRSYKEVVRLRIGWLIAELANKVRESAHQVQIGRTHGQHALPITVGFWLASILSRLVWVAGKLEQSANDLVGKISGAVGAYNAQVGLGFDLPGGNFEENVLARLGLNPADVSTQILPPEPLAGYLFNALLMSGVLAQLGRDCRHLMRTEVGEVSEPFAAGQVGSSTMAHKRNPMTFENIEGMFLGSKGEFAKVLETLVSEHQRDLTGSSLLRDFPTIVVRLVVQLEALLKVEQKGGQPFIARVGVDEAALARNLERSGGVVLAEPLYIALQMAGLEGDAHELVSHKVVPAAGDYGGDLTAAIEAHLEGSPKLAEAWGRVPPEVKRLLRQPKHYTGKAADIAIGTSLRARGFLQANTF